MSATPWNRKRRYALNGFFKILVMILSLLAVTPLFFIFGFILQKGIDSLDWEFITQVPSALGSEHAGGVLNAISGTFLLVGMATLAAIPIGVLTGTYLAEYRKSKISHTLGMAIEILQGIPSIVIGIVVYEIVVIHTGGFSAISGSVALCMMMIPVIARSTEETLRMLPSSLKEASLAMGASYPTTLLRVVLPAGLSGIITGVLISLARVAGETAPLLFTAFGNPYVNWDVTKPVHSLPTLIFNYAISPYDEWHRLAWGAAVVLLGTVLSLNLLARWLSRRWRWY